MQTVKVGVHPNTATLHVDAAQGAEADTAAPHRPTAELVGLRACVTQLDSKGVK